MGMTTQRMKSTLMTSLIEVLTNIGQAHLMMRNLIKTLRVALTRMRDHICRSKILGLFSQKATVTETKIWTLAEDKASMLFVSSDYQKAERERTHRTS